MRAFVAIPLPAEVRAALADYAAAIGLPGLRRIDATDLHVTVHFLGSVADADAARIAAALTPACAGVPAFRLRLAGARLAPRRRPRMVWAALEAPPGFAHLAHAVAAAVAPFAPDARVPRPQAPHVTLARLREPPRRDAGLPEPFVTGEIDVGECALMRSHPDRSGPRYERLAPLPLASQGRH
jgi:RNA 2',3'-cyclic 3'-phosphodiesterase